MVCLLQSCNDSKPITNVEIKLDSIFINQHENKEIEDLPYVFFYYSFFNNTKDTIILDFKMFAALENTNLENARDKAFCVCNKDSIELFDDILDEYIVPPNKAQDIRFDISIDFFIDNNNLKLDTLTFYAQNCKNIFYINSKIVEDLSIKPKVKYRDVDDTLGTQIWK
ncbi:hypothetical protein WAF17_08335 [Bernardetia sp. ABR2-2B]|uniref:hypothetical protein n=1 Tax=Bernardetia sp. ABR2-2B TaxID=3127472 RepID=UPI0030CE44B6